MKSSKKYPNLSIRERLTDEEYNFWCDKQRTYPFYKLPRAPFEYINNGAYTQSDEVKINRAFWRFYRTLELGDVKFKDSGLNTTLELIIQAVTKSVEGAIKKEFGNRSKDTEENQEPKPTRKVSEKTDNKGEVNQETGEVMQTTQDEQDKQSARTETTRIVPPIYNPIPLPQKVDNPTKDDVGRIWDYIIGLYINHSDPDAQKVGINLRGGKIDVVNTVNKVIVTATIYNAVAYKAINKDSEYFAQIFCKYLPGHTFEFKCELENQSGMIFNGRSYVNPEVPDIDDLP